MLDLQILRIMRQKTDYRRVMGRVPKGAFDAATHVILTDFGRYFDNFPEHEEVRMENFIPMFRSWHANLTPEQLSSFDAILKNVATPVPESERAVVMRAVLETRFATDLANSLERWQAGDDIDIRQMVSRHMDNLKADAQISDVEWITTDIGELLQDDMNDAGFRWRLTALNEATRPLRPGDSLIVAGRPDKGKTTFVSSEITNFASQDFLRPEQNILWLNNEGPGARIKPRLYQAALGLSRTELVKRYNSGRLITEYEAVVGREDRIRVFDVHNRDVFSVEQIIERNNAAVVVFDMIDHIRGFEAESSRPDIRFEEMYMWARSRAVEMNFVSIATSQISNEGDGVKFPTLGMLKDSKTGKQGACDLQLMIGALNEPAFQNQRFIGLPKNKIRRDGGPADPQATVHYKSEVCRYEDLAELTTVDDLPEKDQ